MLATKPLRFHPQWLRIRLATPSSRGYAALKKASSQASRRRSVLPGEARIPDTSRSQEPNDYSSRVFRTPPQRGDVKAGKQAKPSWAADTPFTIPDVKPIAEQPPGSIRHTFWIVSGTVFSVALGWYGFVIYRAVTDPLPEHDLDEEIDFTRVYDTTAEEFDAKVDSQEYWSGTMKLRSRLVRQARGDVLESAAGTGRNSEYYIQNRIRSLTLVDQSKEMLHLAEQKWPEERKDEDWTGKIRFVVADLEKDDDKEQLITMSQQHGGSTTSEARFDTIVQTMGLCSTNHPDKLMDSLARLVKPGGKIILLEHGRGYFGWLNTLLDRSARGHAATHGCWWNRDIAAIVQRSGLEVLEMSRPWTQVGTMYHIILRRPSLPENLAKEDTLGSR